MMSGIATPIGNGAATHERYLRRTSGGEPARATRLPREPSGKAADAVKIAFQIRERKFARGFVNRFFPGEAGSSEREYVRFNRLAIAKLIPLADFKKAQAALAMVQIPFERPQHADDSVR